MTKLRYAPNLPLPLDAVTQRFGFLGRIGSGKTYAATKLVELMLEAGAQVVFLDPVGVGYGLRVDGKGKGFPIPVFGGLHGDVPLEPLAGALMADLVVDRRLSCVIDVSQFESDADKARFAAAFAKRFFFRKKVSPSAVHLFLEECQEFIPQNPARGEEQMLHEFTRMAKLGRNFGIGLSLLSQRPQEVNKKVLNLTECLLAFQMTGTHERKAIKEWIATVGADENILNVLPTLPVGVAHVYSPQWLRVSEQVKCYEKRSADVSSTPTVDATPVAAKPLTPVDLGKIREDMAATIEKAKADDPAELRKEIAALKAAAKRNESAVAHVVDQGAVAVAVKNERLRVMKDAHAERNAFIAGIERHLRTMTKFAEELDKHGPWMREMLDRFKSGLPNRFENYGISTEDSRADVQVGHHEQGTGAIRPSVSTVGQQSRSTTRPPVTPRTDTSLSRGAQKLLDAAAKFAAMHLDTPTRTQVAALAPMSPTSSATERYFSELVKGGYFEVTTPGSVKLTAQGERAATPVSTPPSLDEYVTEWQRLLGEGAERKLYDAYISWQYATRPITRDKLAEMARISNTSSATERGFAWLIGLELLEKAGKGEVKAGRTMFPEGLL